MSTTEPDTTDDSSTDTQRPFYAEIDVDVLDAHLDVVGAVVDEVIFEPTDDGIRSLAVDAANVMIIDAELGADEFYAYETNSELIGISIDRLKTAINLGESGQPVTLELDAETWKLNISGPDYDYGIAPIDPSAIRDRPDIPQMDHEVAFTLDSEHIKRATNGCDDVGDYIGIDSTDGEAIQFGVSGDVDDLTFTFTPDDKLKGLGAVGGQEGLYSAEYFGKMVGSIAGPVDVEYSHEHPVFLKFARRGTEATYMLAPRIQGEN